MRLTCLLCVFLVLTNDYVAPDGKPKGLLVHSPVATPASAAVLTSTSYNCLVLMPKIAEEADITMMHLEVLPTLLLTSLLCVHPSLLTPLSSGLGCPIKFPVGINKGLALLFFKGGSACATCTHHELSQTQTASCTAGTPMPNASCLGKDMPKPINTGISIVSSALHVRHDFKRLAVHQGANTHPLSFAA